MLGDAAKAEDVVQEAWLRWNGRRDGDVVDPRAYLVAVVTRLCLNELGSARARREESRGDRLPEPVDLNDGALKGIEAVEQVSMALMVALQRLTPAERAVLLLHDVLDFGHAEVAELVGKTAAACRKLLERARVNVAAEKRLLTASREEHARLLGAFVRAAFQGDVDALVALLADDAVLITDGGPTGRRAGGIRNLTAPLRGARHIAAFICATAGRNRAPVQQTRELNGRPALVLQQDGKPFAALLLGVANGRIHRVFFQADLARLARLAPGRAGQGALHA
jgi:RNA polymerase sigma-70 factor (ECF subfamily)